MSFGPLVAHAIRQAATRHGLDVNVLAAQVHHESGGDPTAVRFEPGWRYFHPFRSPFCSEATERNLQACSWGLMQLMGTVLREQGYREPFLAAIVPDLAQQMEHGASRMRRLLTKLDISDALSAYNAGTPTPLNRSNYVEPILRLAEKYRKEGF